MKNAKKYWEERGSEYKDDIRGVLFKWPYPSFVNNFFHNWSCARVLDYTNKGNVLDIACGWGRVSQKLLRERDNIKIFGIDLSTTYVKLFNKKLRPRGKAIVCDMQDMPYKSNFFETVFLIVSFMYLDSLSKQKKALNEIFRVLKKDGRFILIEPTPLMGLFEVSKYFNRKKVIKRGFTSKFINDLIISSKGEVVRIYSWPFPFVKLYNCYIIKKI